MKKLACDHKRLNVMMKIAFFGTSAFAAELLEFLLASGPTHGIEIALVVTKPDRPQKRSRQPVACPVKMSLSTHAPSLPILQPEIASAPEFAAALKDFHADLFLVVAYGEIIKQHLLDMPPLGCINVHGSLLPALRGAAPIQRSIINGDATGGITIMQMVRKMDAGDMIRSAEVPIGENMTYGELEKALCQAAKQPLLDVLIEYASGITPSHMPQNASEVTFAPKIEVEECQIQWDRPATELHNLIRGVTPEPGAWCYAQIKGEQKRIKISQTTLASDRSGLPGSILQYDKNSLIVACATGALAIGKLQLEGKRSMLAAEFIRGIPLSEIQLGGFHDNS